MAISSLKTGDIVGGRYRLLQPIADGGMARIFKSVDLNSNRTCALKVLFEHLTTHEITRQRFLSEARLQQRLSHPNIVQVFHVYEAPHLCFAMEYIDGPTLDEVLTTRGALPYQLIYTIMVPALRAISYAHTMGVIHRDLKPSNILLDFDPKTDTYITKVMDFGVARNVREVTKLTAAGTTVGTLHYMSPEQIRGEVDLDERADVYSIGVTLYKLVAGRVPFNATNEFALMMAQVEKSPVPPSAFRPDIPQALEKVILKAMDKERSNRFVSVSQLLEAFSRVFNATHKVSLREMKGAYSVAENTNKFSRKDVSLFPNYSPQILTATEQEYDLLNPFGQEEGDENNEGLPPIESDPSEMETDEIQNVMPTSERGGPNRRKPLDSQEVPPPRILPLRPPKSRTRRPNIGGLTSASTSEVTLLHTKNDPFETITQLLDTVEPDKIAPLTSSAVLFIQDQQPIEKTEKRPEKPKARTVKHSGSGELFTIRDAPQEKSSGRLMPLPMPSREGPPQKTHPIGDLSTSPIRNAPPKRRETSNQIGFERDSDVIPEFSLIEPAKNKPDYTAVVIACVVVAIMAGFFIFIQM